ncbi:PTS system IIA component, Glc family /PTS system IIB component, Glc family /PTS system IIC component, Glc family [Raineyella antarctica]|uniref:PTS system IIA component, Glc family /PTS system IIB component, Glc family /PTS system IIC component, Glc family n=1 Tax=Raineyella antarctica TaxID=1577474 RepID=A0A1G6H6U3_9ACTN|nr:glucose PTS transporter subunit IIA [Raineyella antarctica]SDB89990.1 PTS system IIA component, Glc family /PTS system IIB component, Glc family /PTS system IIC component, Glc family [Raineyella antarctica]
MATSPASDIVSGVGGPENIESFTHCATRLRFQLRDGTKVDTATVEAIPGVMGAVPQAGNRYQVVIGGAVTSVYEDIHNLPEMKNVGAPSPDDIKAAARAGGPRGKFAWLDSFFEFLSDSFRPIIGALLGASLFITFMSLMSTLHVIGNWADPRTTLPPSWQFVNLCWQSVFVFLPLMVAYNASKKLGADPWVGFAIMAVVMLPGFAALKDASTQMKFAGSAIDVVQIFGFPLTIFNYSSQVFPPLLMAGVLGALDRLLRRVIPDNVQLIFVPFLSMLIMIPLTAFLIGPIGVYAGAGLAHILGQVNNFSPFIFAILVPLLYPFMVPLGLHWPINAIMLLNIQNLGYDYIQGPMGSWNFAAFGATAAVLILAIRNKEKAMRQTATGALAAGLLGGISEPSLYGIHLRYKRIYPRMLVGCLVGGIITGFAGGIHTKAFVFTSLLTIPAFDKIGWYSLAVGASFLTSMVLVLLSGYKTAEQKELERLSEEAAALAHVPGDQLTEAELVPAYVGAGAVGVGAGSATAAAVRGDVSASTISAPGTGEPGERRRLKPAMEPGTVTQIHAPLAGSLLPLAEVPDPVFARGTVGAGVGIVPSGDTVYAPAPGKILVAQETGHAFGLRLDSGIELLIHVGIDTVNMGGRGFDVKVHTGDRVEAGDPLVVFDRKAIEAAGYSTVTPVLVTNVKKFDSVHQAASGEVDVATPILIVVAKPAGTV